MIQWPAVIKYHGDHELIYIESFAEWQHDPDLCLPNYEAEDRLIDVSGALFVLPTAPLLADTDMFTPLNTQISVPEFVKLVRQHAVIENYCCSAKINAKTHQQVIAMVKEINSF